MRRKVQKVSIDGKEYSYSLSESSISQVLGEQYSVLRLSLEQIGKIVYHGLEGRPISESSFMDSITGKGTRVIFKMKHYSLYDLRWKIYDRIKEIRRNANHYIYQS